MSLFDGGLTFGVHPGAWSHSRIHWTSGLPWRRESQDDGCSAVLVDGALIVGSKLGRFVLASRDLDAVVRLMDLLEEGLPELIGELGAVGLAVTELAEMQGGRRSVNQRSLHAVW